MTFGQVLDRSLLIIAAVVPLESVVSLAQARRGTLEKAITRTALMIRWLTKILQPFLLSAQSWESTLRGNEIPPSLKLA